MSRKKISRTVYITVEQDDAIRKLSIEQKIPQARLIREGIERALAWRREPHTATVTRVAVLIARGGHEQAPELCQALAAELRLMLELTHELRQERAEADDRVLRLRAHLRQIAQDIADRLDAPLLSR